MSRTFGTQKLCAKEDLATKEQKVRHPPLRSRCFRDFGDCTKKKVNKKCCPRERERYCRAHPAQDLKKHKERVSSRLQVRGVLTRDPVLCRVLESVQNSCNQINIAKQSNHSA